MVEVEGVNEESVMDESASAMLRTKMRGETSTTGGRPRRERWNLKRATTDTLRRRLEFELDGDGIDGDEDGEGGPALNNVRIFIAEHSRWGQRLGAFEGVLEQPSSSPSAVF